MKHKNKLLVEYMLSDYDQSERQKRLDDAFDVIFDEIEVENIERINSKNEYEHPVIIKR